MILCLCFSGFRDPAQSCFKYHVASFYCCGFTVAICPLFVPPWTQSKCQPEKCTLILLSQNKHACWCMCTFVCKCLYTAATFCHLNSSCVAHRIKRHASFFSLPSSQTEQEMRKLKINPIKNNYFLPRWMCSTCARADNTFNNPALLLICVKMVFKFSERSKWSKYKKPSRVIERACYKRSVMQVGIHRRNDVGLGCIIAKCNVLFWIYLFSPISQGKIIFRLILKGKLYIQHPKCRRKNTL